VAIIEGISIGILVGQYVYHRWKGGDDNPTPAKEIQLARVDEGAPYAQIYGRCRIRQPILAWHSSPQFTWHEFDEGVIETLYAMDMFFVLGFPMRDGARNKIHGLWLGELAMPPYEYSVPPLYTPAESFDELTGDGGYERSTRVLAVVRQDGSRAFGGEIEFLRGGEAQELVNDAGVAVTLAGEKMLANGVPAASIPGYRGMMCILLTQHAIDLDPNVAADFIPERFVIGPSPQVPAVSVEASSYAFPWLTNLESHTLIGDDANPADVIYDILWNTRARLGLPLERIDRFSFELAAIQLKAESHGYSLAIEDSRPAEKIIEDILIQIDGVVYEDPRDGKIKIRLVRGDYDPSATLHITRDNCDELKMAASRGWSNITNKIRVAFENRQNAYRDDSATAQNQANAGGADAGELVIQAPGCKTMTLAREIAARELSATSRPIAKCSAYVNSDFYYTVVGDVVRVTWPEIGWSEMLFRVADVDRGTNENGKIRLDLIQDFFYVRRGVLNPIPPLPPFPEGPFG